MQADYDQAGLEAFKFSVLALIDDLDARRAKEIEMIASDASCYNIFGQMNSAIALVSDLLAKCCRMNIETK